VNYHNRHKMTAGASGGFTVVEIVVSITLVAATFALSLGALTKWNAIASTSRTYTGAYVAAQKRIDWILSAGPFNPQKNQVPTDVVTNCDGTTTTVQLAPGTYTETTAPIYNDPQTTTVNGILQLLGLGKSANGCPTLTGTVTTQVVDVSPAGGPPYIYRATITVSYQYRARGPIWSPTRNRWEYQVSMSTLRTSDI
jgi:type II secretory pathway pseudopilin PulG